MLRIEKGKQTSFYSTLYDKIPEKHLLKRIDKSVDFSFINKLLEDRYCKNFGRPAKEPEVIAKLLFLYSMVGRFLVLKSGKDPSPVLQLKLIIIAARDFTRAFYYTSRLVLFIILLTIARKNVTIQKKTEFQNQGAGTK